MRACLQDFTAVGKPAPSGPWGLQRGHAQPSEGPGPTERPLTAAVGVEASWAWASMGRAPRAVAAGCRGPDLGRGAQAGHPKLWKGSSKGRAQARSRFLGEWWPLAAGSAPTQKVAWAQTERENET